MRRMQVAEPEAPLIEPSEGEKRNGWDAESLTAYLSQQDAATQAKLDPHAEHRRQTRPQAMNKYRPLGWHR